MSSSLVKVDVNRGKLIKFQLDVRGMENNQRLSGKFVVIANDIEYGFPAIITNNKVEVKLPSLLDVIRNIETFKSYMKAKLCVYSDFQYFIPWEGKLKVLTPGTIKASLKTEAKAPQLKMILLPPHHH